MSSRCVHLQQNDHLCGLTNRSASSQRRSRLGTAFSGTRRLITAGIEQNGSQRSNASQSAARILRRPRNLLPRCGEIDRGAISTGGNTRFTSLVCIKSAQNYVLFARSVLQSAKPVREPYLRNVSVISPVANYCVLIIAASTPRPKLHIALRSPSFRARPHLSSKYQWSGVAHGIHVYKRKRCCSRPGL